MAITASIHFTSPSFSPLFYPKTHGSFLSPFSQPQNSIRKLDCCSFLSVCSRQNSPCAVNLNSRIVKAQASLQGEPIVPPFNVLITGSTKGQSLCFWVSLSFELLWFLRFCFANLVLLFRVFFFFFEILVRSHRIKRPDWVLKLGNGFEIVHSFLKNSVTKVFLEFVLLQYHIES